MAEPLACCESDRVKAVHHAVLGNGEPESSLVVRVGNVERDVKAIKRIMWTQLSAVITLLVGSAIALMSHLLKS